MPSASTDAPFKPPEKDKAKTLPAEDTEPAAAVASSAATSSFAQAKPREPQQPQYAPESLPKKEKQQQHHHRHAAAHALRSRALAL